MANKAISIAVLILCTAAISCNAAAPAAFTTFNVMSYGAKPGSKEESTQVGYYVIFVESNLYLKETEHQIC